MTAAAFIRILRARNDLIAAMDARLAQFDALVLPTVPTSCTSHRTA